MSHSKYSTHFQELRKYKIHRFHSHCCLATLFENSQADWKFEHINLILNPIDSQLSKYYSSCCLNSPHSPLDIKHNRLRYSYIFQQYSHCKQNHHKNGNHQTYIHKIGIHSCLSKPRDAYYYCCIKYLAVRKLYKIGDYSRYDIPRFVHLMIVYDSPPSSVTMILFDGKQIFSPLYLKLLLLLLCHPSHSIQML